jgi:hypothetical protein
MRRQRSSASSAVLPNDGKFEIQEQEATTMPIKHEEIIEDLEDHMRNLGGGRSEWCVGTAT